MKSSGSGEFARALKAKQTKQRRRKLWTYGIVGALVILVGFSVYALYFSPWLVVRDVTVEGVNLLSEDEVLETAAVETDRPVASTDTSAIAERIAGMVPVDEVTVSRQFPDTIVISVTERVPEYQLATDEGYEWVDADGVSFHSVAEADPDLLVADIPEPTSRLLRDVATVAHWIPGDVAPEVTGITATAVDGITLTLTENREVIWGSAEESEFKGEVLGTLLQVEAEVYDVSAPEYPTTR